MPANPNKFSVSKIPNMHGKIILITGSNTGIGYESALALAGKGAHVYMACRSESKAQEAMDRIKKEHPEAKLSYLKLDLQDLNQVKQAAADFTSREVRLDVLLNNAGIMMPPFEVTKDGIETQFGTNHVGHFLFTRELIPLLLKSSEPRIVNLSSLAHEWAPKEGILFDKINDKDAMTDRDRYGQSKLANLLFSRELNKRYGEKIYVNSVHPGVVATELGRSIVEKLGIWKYPLYPVILAAKFILLTPAKGALTSLYCASSENIVKEGIKGKYFIPIAQESKTTDLATDDELSEKLWDFTEKLVEEKLAQ